MSILPLWDQRLLASDELMGVANLRVLSIRTLWQSLFEDLCWSDVEIQRRFRCEVDVLIILLSSYPELLSTGCCIERVGYVDRCVIENKIGLSSWNGLVCTLTLA